MTDATGIDTDECSRCGAGMVELRFDQPMTLSFTLPNDDDVAVYHQVHRTLCTGCERDLLAWIDDGDIDRSDCVDLPDRLATADALQTTADELDSIAHDLRTTLHSDTDD